MKYYATVDGQEFVVEILPEGILVNGTAVNVDFQELPDNGMVSLLINHSSYEAVIEEQTDSQIEVLLRGELYMVEVQDERARRLAQARGESSVPSGESTIKSPMPGIIVATPLPEKTAVQKGQTVIILESMKMENELKSPQDGLVARVLVKPGDSVEKGQVLAVITDPNAEEDSQA